MHIRFLLLIMTFASGLNALLQRFMSRASSKSPMSSPRSLDHDSEVRKEMTIFSLNSLPPWEIVHAYMSSADFFQNQFFRKVLSQIPSECQTDWIQNRPDILWG